MAKRDLSTWVPKLEAAERLGISARSIERLVESKKVRAALRPTPGKKAILVIAPEEIGRLALELKVRDSATGRTLEPSPGTGKSHAAAVATLFMSIEQASELAGLSVATLQKFIDTGTLATVETDEGLRIRRRDLESL